jgi:nucleotide-binding universal stress UspA family protein
MSIKDIIVYVDNDANCENRLESATSLCKALDARLNGLYLLQKISIPAYAGAYVPVEVFEANDEQTEKLHDQAKAVFSAKSEAVDIISEFNAVEGDVGASINRYSRYADLLLVPQRKNDRFDFNPYYQLSDILLGAACPVLMLPDSKPPALPPESVLLAWNGERECARALKAAMPLLSQVKKIDIVSVNREDDEAKEIASHLNRHGFETEIHSVENGHFDSGGLLLNKATELGSQMLIMGAYGHSRIRELMLGGTTMHVLEHTDLPVLFSH